MDKWVEQHILMDKWVKQHNELKKCDFQKFMTKVRGALKQEYPDEAQRGDTHVTATAPATYVSMDKDLFDF
ncbi:hypothetical protein EB796_008168 [Bugula neritina]|uniref:Uncharacterized protein n=1 Tax=Bugula neritina TaxID=10212 RepID=A0A7J7K4G4_BUGNE|nr:hypothetical protein EB796_008168 [Bugula neritina]